MKIQPTTPPKLQTVDPIVKIHNDNAFASLRRWIITLMEPKHYAREYFMEFTVAVIMIFISSGIAIYFGTFAVKKYFADEITDGTLLFFLAFAILLVIYIVEILNIIQYIRRNSVGREGLRGHLVLAILISLFNSSVTFMGIITHTQKAESKTELIYQQQLKNGIDSIESVYGPDITYYKDLINSIRLNAKSQWKGVMTSQDKELLMTYEASLNKLYIELRTETGRYRAKHKERIETSKKDFDFTLIIKILIAFVIELTIVLSSRSIGVYFSRIFDESRKIESSPTLQQNLTNVKKTNGQAQPEQAFEFVKDAEPVHK